MKYLAWFGYEYLKTVAILTALFVGFCALMLIPEFLLLTGSLTLILWGVKGILRN